MSMATDDERREVARRLRDMRLNPWDDAACEIAQCAGIVCCNSECHGSDETPECTMALAHRLADLIEPESERTCRVESSHEEEGDGCYSYFKYELTCGHEIAWGDQLPPSYCPECGRRVLYDVNKYL